MEPSRENAASQRQHRSAHLVFHFVGDGRVEGHVRVLAARIESICAEIVKALSVADPDKTQVVIHLLDAPEERIRSQESICKSLRLVWRPDTADSRVERAVIDRILSDWLGPRAAFATPLIDGLLGHVARLADRQPRLRLAPEDVGISVEGVLARVTEARPALPGEAKAVLGPQAHPRYHDVMSSFVSFLLDVHGADNFKTFARGFDAHAPDKAAEAAYGKPIKVLEREWGTYLEAADRPGLGLWGVLRQSLSYWRPHWKMAIKLLLTLVVTQLFATFFAYSLKLIIDKALVARDATMLAKILGGLGIGFVLSSLANVYGDYLNAAIGAAILNTVRMDMFKHLQRLSMGYYARTESGDIVARFASDVSDIDKAVCVRVIDGLIAAVGVLVNLPLLFLLDWRLAGVMMLGTPLLFVGTRVFTTKAATARYRLKKDEAQLIGAIQENVRAQSVIKVFGLQTSATERFAAQLDQVGRSYVRANFMGNLVGTMSSLGVLMVQMFVIAAGSWLAFHGNLSVGSLVAFVSLHVGMSKHAYDLTKKVIPGLISASGGMQRIAELLDENLEVGDLPEAKTLPKIGPSDSFRFEDVTFSYGGQQKNLDHVSLTIPVGQSIALVGPSGSGKSTILNMVLRYYDPQEGRVTLSGEDLRAVTQGSLHAQMGAVFQDTFLFNRSIRDNIRLGKLTATDDEVETAARAAEIHELIMAMPRRYDTLAGDMGGRLSGGQRQRVAIARAILRDPAILVLDEATSALDPATEHAVNGTLERLAKNRTVISVSHRLAAVRNADRIFVFDHGKLAEDGTHDELIARRGLYHYLWMKQGSVEVSAEGRSATIKAERLKDVPLFENAGPELLETLAGKLVFERIEGGKDVFAKGDAGDKFYIVARGKVEVLDVGFEDKERQVAVLGDGDFFGEMALLEDVPRSATVRTITPCSFLCLGRGQFDELMKASPKLRASVEEVVTRRRAELDVE